MTAPFNGGVLTHLTPDEFPTQTRLLAQMIHGHGKGRVYSWHSDDMSVPARGWTIVAVGSEPVGWLLGGPRRMWVAGDGRFFAGYVRGGAGRIIVLEGSNRLRAHGMLEMSSCARGVTMRERILVAGVVWACCLPGVVFGVIVDHRIVNSEVAYGTVSVNAAYSDLDAFESSNLLSTQLAQSVETDFGEPRLAGLAETNSEHSRIWTSFSVPLPTWETLSRHSTTSFRRMRTRSARTWVCRPHFRSPQPTNGRCRMNCSVVSLAFRQTK